MYFSSYSSDQIRLGEFAPRFFYVVKRYTLMYKPDYETGTYFGFVRLFEKSEAAAGGFSFIPAHFIQHYMVKILAE